jgi:hypothetical protein
MIITYPIHVDYTAGTDQRVLPDSIFNCCEKLSGSYPMGKNRFWHGGVHMHPADRSAPIRAIADGDLVAYRFDEKDETDAYFEKTPYSRNFVLLKHEAELGQTSLGLSKITFYSLYMHLQAWSQAKTKNGPLKVNLVKGGSVVADGCCQLGNEKQKVQRGDILGFCGSVPDNFATPSTGLHFEIFFDDVSFLANEHKTVWGHCKLTKDLQVFEELLITETLTVDIAKPLIVDNLGSTENYVKISSGRRKYWISVDQIYPKETEFTDPKRREKITTKKEYFSIKSTLNAYRKNPNKNEKTLAKETSIIPWLDPWLKKGEFREENINGKTFVQVYFSKTNDIFWAEKSKIFYVSDADWINFNKVEEHGKYSKDGFIDDDGLKKLCAISEDHPPSNIKKTDLGDAEKILLLLTRHPTEWCKRDISKRFERVTKDEFGTGKLTPEQFAKLTLHISRLAFWDDVPGLPSIDNIWHAHPIKFIESLAKCMWLSKTELSQIYPSKPGSGEDFNHGTSDETREKYRNDINKCCYRYGVNSRLRQSHFFGQGAVESSSLKLMLEDGTGEKYEKRENIGNTQPGDGPRFKGRGFKQLTGRYNYGEYWAFRGWLEKGQDFDIGWEKDKKKRFPKIDDPDKLIRDTFSCVDAGCWYIARLRTKTVIAMDGDDIGQVTEAINGADGGLADRIKSTKRIKKVLL